MIREHARSPKGQKIIGDYSGKKYMRISFCASLMKGEILAPLVYQGTMNQKLFEEYIKMLLTELPKGKVIVLDNAAIHKSKKVEQMIKKSKCKLVFLPPYCPYLNPIENFWAWFKSKIRDIGSSFLTLQEVIDHVFQKQNCIYNNP